MIRDQEQRTAVPDPFLDGDCFGVRESGSAWRRRPVGLAVLMHGVGNDEDAGSS